MITFMDLRYSARRDVFKYFFAMRGHKIAHAWQDCKRYDKSELYIYSELESLRA